MPIFDQGYQHWQGPLTAFRWRWLAVARHGVRATLKSKIVRIMLLLAWVPALALVVVLALWGLLEQQAESVLTFLKQILPPDVIAKPQEYRAAVWTIVYDYFFKTELTWTIFLVLAVGPSLISKDLRFNALPLYFSRPIRRLDYFLGKLGVIAFFIAATTIAPALVAYLFGIAFSLDLSVIRDTHRLLWAGLAYGLVITLSAGTLMLALSSLSRRSIYVGITWAGFCFLTTMVSGILIGLQFHGHQNEIVRAEMEIWLTDHPPPAGIEMHGIYPEGRRRRRERVPEPAENQAEIDRFYDEWSNAIGSAYALSGEELARDTMASSNWRPAVSYTSNLSRIGDALFNVDQAWVTIGKTIERPRAAMAPALAIHSHGNVPKQLLGPANERALADRMAWQFPWQWSALILAGLWLLSILVLSSRVKSLDRLK
ncbi:MAG: ABC transporter permease [Gemmataceae bacterium]